MSHRSDDEQLLERLRVPFGTFALDGSVLYVSPSALPLVRTESPNLLCELSDMAKRFGHYLLRAQSRVAPLEGRVTRPHWDHAVEVTMHAVESAGVISHVLCALVVVPPPTTSRSMISIATPAVIEQILVSRGLSQREREVAVLLWAGLTSAEIAAQLNVTVHTARRHTEQVLRKLRITSRAAVGRVIANAADALARSQRVMAGGPSVISA